MTQSKSKLFFLCIVLLLPILGFFFSLSFSFPYLVNVVLIYLLPGILIILASKHHRHLLRLAAFAAIVSFPFAVIVDYIGIKSDIWYVPHSVFPSRFMGVIPFEDFLWIASGLFTMVVLHAYFQRDWGGSIVNRKMGYYVFFASMALLVFFFIRQWQPGWLIWKSAFGYAALASVFFLLPAALFITSKIVSTHIWKVVLIFFFSTFIFEVLAASLGYWEFNGQYLVHQFTFFGDHHVPFEELFFVGIVAPVAGAGFFTILLSKRRSE